MQAFDAKKRAAEAALCCGYRINDLIVVIVIVIVIVVITSYFANVEWPHHFMVLMRQDVTMPDVSTRFGEGHLDARDLARQRHDHVAPGSLGRCRRYADAIRCGLLYPKSVTFTAVML